MLYQKLGMIIISPCYPFNHPLMGMIILYDPLLSAKIELTALAIHKCIYCDPPTLCITLAKAIITRKQLMTGLEVVV